MEAVSLGVVISFTAGLLSFLSPCVLPLIPSYVTFVTGLSLEDVQRSRKTALVHSLLFVAGFSLIFLALGATATAVGRLLLVHRQWISRVGGVLVVLLGLYLLGAFNMRFLARERRFHISDKPLGYLGVIGSLHKSRVFRARLPAPRRALWDAGVRCPIGRKIPSKNPKAIAVSMAAEPSWGGGSIFSGRPHAAISTRNAAMSISWSNSIAHIPTRCRSGRISD